jgi:hypothetical protein
MVDYTKALKQGFEAARRADAARKEIDEVFIELNNQVLKATDNKLSIERREYEEQQSYPNISLSAFMGAQTINVWYIVAYNPTIGKNKEAKIARWVRDKAGYPCIVKWSDQERICEDREALSLSLSELLSDPIVGQILYRLSNMEPQKKQKG